MLASHSPEQLSSPRMPLSPMAAKSGLGGPAFSLCGSKSSVIGAAESLLASRGVDSGNSMVAYLAEGVRTDAEMGPAAHWEGIDAATDDRSQAGPKLAANNSMQRVEK